MHKVTAEHLLEVYKARLEMQEQGVTNPLDYIKIFTRQLVEKLTQLPQGELIEFRGNKLIDNKENVIADFNKKQVFQFFRIKSITEQSKMKLEKYNIKSEG